MLKGFLEPNLDELNLDFVALLWGTSSIASTTASLSAAEAVLGMGTKDLKRWWALAHTQYIYYF